MDYWKKIRLKFIGNKHDNKLMFMYYCVVLLILVGSALIVFLESVSSTWNSRDGWIFELLISQFIFLLYILVLINRFRQFDTYKKISLTFFLSLREKFLEDKLWWNAKVGNYKRLSMPFSSIYFTIWVVYKIWLYYSITVVIDTLIWPLYCYVEFYLNMAYLTFYFSVIGEFYWADFQILLKLHII